MNVLIVVTHLLGTGHLARALTLARALHSNGEEVTVISGGMPAPHLDHGDVSFVQLPPLRSDGVDFTRLLDKDGALASDALLLDRRTSLLRAYSQTQWDVVVTELFPFGRRILRDEFLALLQAAHTQSPKPLVCASVRDILAPPSKPEKVTKTEAILSQYYDHVLVHSDANVVPIDLSWPTSKMLRSKLFYTGFVTPPPAPPHPQQMGRGEVLVSAGGGDVGAEIFATALGAAAGSPLVWRLLIGGKDAEKRAAELGRNAPSNVIVEPARADFRQLLRHAEASVSMCGYNTALDVLQAGCPAVFVPFDAGKEVEQGLRAGALGEMDGIEVLNTAELTVQTLRRRLETVLQAPPRMPRTSGFDGAPRTAQLLRKLRGSPV